MRTDNPIEALYDLVGVQFSKAELEHAIPLLYFGALTAASPEVPAALRELLERFNLEAGIEERDLSSGEAFARKLNRFYADRPVCDAVKKAIQRAVATLGERAATRAESARELLGARAAKVPVGHRPAEPGSVRGGPLSMLNVNKAVDKKVRTTKNGR